MLCLRDRENGWGKSQRQRENRRRRGLQEEKTEWNGESGRIKEEGERKEGKSLCIVLDWPAVINFDILFPSFRHLFENAEMICGNYHGKSIRETFASIFCVGVKVSMPQQKKRVRSKQNWIRNFSYDCLWIKYTQRIQFIFNDFQ